jgi:hypothetical protein
MEYSTKNLYKVCFIEWYSGDKDEDGSKCSHKIVATSAQEAIDLGRQLTETDTIQAELFSCEPIYEGICVFNQGGRVT